MTYSFWDSSIALRQLENKNVFRIYHKDYYPHLPNNEIPTAMNETQVSVFKTKKIFQKSKIIKNVFLSMIKMLANDYIKF